MTELLHQLELLCGQKSALDTLFGSQGIVAPEAFETSPIGVSTLNELLLTAGFDAVSDDFFALLSQGTPTRYEHKM